MGLWQEFQDEPVHRLSLRTPVIGRPTDTLREGIARMREQKLGCVIVVDEGDKPIGIFTEGRLTRLIKEQGSSVLDTQLQDCMMSPCPHVLWDDPIQYVVDALQLKNVRFLCVVDKEGRVAGLTGQKGLVEFVSEHFPNQVMVQRMGGRAYTNEREGA